MPGDPRTVYRRPLRDLPDPLPVTPAAGPFAMSVRPPGSKSLTNRVYLLAALATGTSLVRGPLRADDTDRLLAALCTLGAEAAWDGDDVRVTGVGGRFPRGGRVDLGDGGTPSRFMIAAACLAAAPVIVDGSPRMRERPVAEGVDLLRRLGATIDYVETDGRLPVRVHAGASIRGGTIEVPTTASSQFISALLLIGPCLPDGIRLRYAGVVTSPSYIAMTVRALRAAGVTMDPADPAPAAGGAHAVEPGPLPAQTFSVEPDASSAAYWLAAAAMRPGARATILDLPRDSEQPDMAVPTALFAAGAEDVSEAGGLALAGPDRLRPLNVDCGNAPDGALALAAAAWSASGPSSLTGLETLRVKESDRITALATELRRVGCSVTATDDTLHIDPSGKHDRPVVIETYDDHRMAMAFAILGLCRPGISIADPACVAKSYPGFWRDLAGVDGG